jgi:starch synthase
MPDGLRVLFLASEADPLVKIGGLGDVAGSLSKALCNLPPEPGSQPMDVRLVIPFHGAIQREAYSLSHAASLQVPYQGGVTPADVFSLDLDGLPVYLISGPLIPPEAPVYTSDAGVDGKKYTFFSLAALVLARAVGWAPHILHANDWHTALAIYALSLTRDRDPFFNKTATVLGLHNLPYLGMGVGPALDAFDLPPAVDSQLPKWAQRLPLPLGLLTADRVIAVSPTYAREILTPEFGSGLHNFLRIRADAISGILNGLDAQYWDPRRDILLAVQFDQDTLADRQVNKRALQNELGLEADGDQPLFSIVARMDYQKGLDLVPGALRAIADQPWQAVILGTGDPILGAAFRKLEADFPRQVRSVIRYDASLSHRIYGGADSLLIPSRYEPCGLTQMIAMHYGCVPVARATGGLRDTIQDYSQSAQSTGFLFDDPTSDALATALVRVLQVFKDKGEWQRLQRIGMAQDFSWRRSARQYLAAYQSLVSTRSLDSKN